MGYALLVQFIGGIYAIKTIKYSAFKTRNRWRHINIYIDRMQEKTDLYTKFPSKIFFLFYGERRVIFLCMVNGLIPPPPHSLFGRKNELLLNH